MNVREWLKYCADVWCHARLVATDMGNRGANSAGMSKAPKLTVEESVGHMVKVVCVEFV